MKGDYNMFGNSSSDIFLNLSDYIIIAIPIIIIVILFVFILYRIFRNPFEYPYFIYKFDVTSKRNIKFENYIDNFLISEKNWQMMRDDKLSVQSMGFAVSIINLDSACTSIRVMLISSINTVKSK